MGILQNLAFLAKKNKQIDSSQAQSSQQLQKKVLIVEDEKTLADALELRLTREGFKVIRAEDGQRGLEVVTSEKPDIILLDLLMPVMDGKTMLHKLREMPEFTTLPVIILTNAGNVENMREAKLFDHANEFLIKSNVSEDEVIQRVKALISSQS